MVISFLLQNIIKMQYKCHMPHTKEAIFRLMCSRYTLLCLCSCLDIFQQAKLGEYMIGFTSYHTFEIIVRVEFDQSKRIDRQIVHVPIMRTKDGFYYLKGPLTENATPKFKNIVHLINYWAEQSKQDNPPYLWSDTEGFVPIALERPFQSYNGMPYSLKDFARKTIYNSMKFSDVVSGKSFTEHKLPQHLVLYLKDFWDLACFVNDYY